MAAAALAVSLASSQATPVYSQNVVGYVNASLPSAGSSYLISVPFNIGVSNGANEVFDPLPDGSEVLIWNTGNNSYTGFYSDSGNTDTGWDDAITYAAVPPPKLPAGTGFFVIPAGATTVTFAGSVAVNIGGSALTVFPSAGSTYATACIVPYTGSLSAGTSAGGGPAMNAGNGLPDGSEVLMWNSGNNSYTGFYSDSGNTDTGWDDAITYASVPPPSLATPAQGFLFVPASPWTWTVGLNP